MTKHGRASILLLAVVNAIPPIVMGWRWLSVADEWELERWKFEVVLAGYLLTTVPALLLRRKRPVLALVLLLAYTAETLWVVSGPYRDGLMGASP